MLNTKSEWQECLKLSMVRTRGGLPEQVVLYLTGTGVKHPHASYLLPHPVWAAATVFRGRQALINPFQAAAALLNEHIMNREN